VNKSGAWTRRKILQTSISASLLPVLGWTKQDEILRRLIPSTTETLPVIGLGTARAFDVPVTPESVAQRRAVVDVLIQTGASLVDTSPMYGNAESMIGEVILESDRRKSLFLASKVWTDGKVAGEQQIQQSMQRMDSEIIDLMQVHNLRDIETQFPTISEWKDRAKIRYTGITTSRRNAFDDMASAMRAWRPDFVQLNYSLGERDAEQELLPLAEKLGIGVLVNRPFMNGALFRAVKDRALPAWAEDFEASSWGQFFLKYIVSHPAVNCVIPATTKARHMVDNLGAGFGQLPDSSMRRKMEAWFASL
jgi:diketogulonate reductase-like aldo/keto reductase